MLHPRTVHVLNVMFGAQVLLSLNVCTSPGLIGNLLEWRVYCSNNNRVIWLCSESLFTVVFISCKIFEKYWSLIWGSSPSENWPTLWSHIRDILSSRVFSFPASWELNLGCFITCCSQQEKERLSFFFFPLKAFLALFALRDRFYLMKKNSSL